MIKFQPIRVIELEGYSNIPCALVFDKIDLSTVQKADDSISFISLITKWRDKEFQSLFFIQNAVIPNVVMIDPVIASFDGVLAFPVEMSEMLQEYENVNFEVGTIEKKTDFSEKFIDIMSMYTEMNGDADTGAAVQILKKLDEIESITADEFALLSPLENAPKMSKFLLKKIQEKVSI